MERLKVDLLYAQSNLRYFVEPLQEEYSSMYEMVQHMRCLCQIPLPLVFSV